MGLEPSIIPGERKSGTQKAGNMGLELSAVPGEKTKPGVGTERGPHAQHGPRVGGGEGNQDVVGAKHSPEFSMLPGEKRT